MELAIAVTVWLTFAAYLILPTLEAPPIFARMAIGLCGSELVAAVVWGVAREGCRSGDCPALTATAASVAGLQIPILSAGVLALAFTYGVFTVRNW